jgi:hypothetical protein
MKTYAVLVPMLSLALVGFAGQTNQVELHHTAPAPAPAPSPPPRDSGVSPGLSAAQTNAVVKLLREEKNYDGVLPELRRQRVQFFRAPPPSSSVPFHNVSINPMTGQAEGIVLFSVKF